ncbi:MAG: hypothetical protein NZ518_07175 [Dehalococcoidia bacterium]|nr:hypothetical protein [Dehalococcoidia bacterium]
MITALFAIAAAIDRPGRLRQIVEPRPPGFFARPALVACDGAQVTAADWDATGALTLGLIPTGRGPVSLTATAVAGALSVDRGQVAQIGPAADGARRAILALDGPARVWWPREHTP